MAKARLGAVLSELSGLLGEEIILQTRTGRVVRRRPAFRRPTSATQQAVQDRMSAVMHAYNGLTQAQAMAWNAYAQTLTRHNPTDGTTYHPTGQNVFVGLANKFLQIDPAGAIPLTPPASAFEGDLLTVTVTGGTGEILFTASGPNTAPAQTELLLQRLKTPRRAPKPFYKSQGFVAFTAGSLQHALSVPAGFYAGAYRFVNAQTGQMTDLRTLPVVEVG